MLLWTINGNGRRRRRSHTTWLSGSNSSHGRDVSRLRHCIQSKSKITATRCVKHSFWLRLPLHLNGVEQLLNNFLAEFLWNDWGKQGKNSIASEANLKLGTCGADKLLPVRTRRRRTDGRTDIRPMISSPHQSKLGLMTNESPALRAKMCVNEVVLLAPLGGSATTEWIDHVIHPRKLGSSQPRSVRSRSVWGNSPPETYKQQTVRHGNGFEWIIFVANFANNCPRILHSFRVTSSVVIQKLRCRKI